MSVVAALLLIAVILYVAWHLPKSPRRRPRPRRRDDDEDDVIGSGLV